MSKFLQPFKGKSGSDSEKPSKKAGFQKASTGGLSSKVTIVENNTDYKLYLRDIIGTGYGVVRYTIPAKSSKEVTRLQSSSFSLIVYVVEEDKVVEQSGSKPEPSTGNPKEKKTSVDTKLTVTCDQLQECKVITIKKEGGNYSAEYSPRG